MFSSSFHRTYLRVKEEHQLCTFPLSVVPMDLRLGSLNIKPHSHNFNHISLLMTHNLQFTGAFHEDSMSTAPTSNVSSGGVTCVLFSWY